MLYEKGWGMIPWLQYEVEMEIRCCSVVYELGIVSCMIGCLYTHACQHDISIYRNSLIGW